MKRRMALPLLLGLTLLHTPSWSAERLDPIVVIAPPEEETVTTDPLEGYNRAMFSFNESLDQHLLKPVAEGYRDLMPDLVERGVSNFFSNLREPFNIINNLLQFKLEEAVSDTMRFTINTTLGLGGILDIATEAQIPKHDEDFGQTLAVWGVESGPYFVLPVLGPSTLRDTVGLGTELWAGNTTQVGGNNILDLTSEITPASSELATDLTQAISKRADLLEEKEMIDQASFDNYLFIRDAYLQKRESMILDGNVPLPPLPIDF